MLGACVVCTWRMDFVILRSIIYSVFRSSAILFARTLVVFRRSGFAYPASSRVEESPTRNRTHMRRAARGLLDIVIAKTLRGRLGYFVPALLLQPAFFRIGAHFYSKPFCLLFFFFIIRTLFIIEISDLAFTARVPFLPLSSLS